LPILKGHNDTRRDIKGNDARRLLTPWPGELIYLIDGQIFRWTSKQSEKATEGFPLDLSRVRMADESEKTKNENSSQGQGVVVK
jgi:hypothetical protein